MFEFAEIIEATGLSLWIAQTGWLWPVLEVFHFFGLSLIIGGLLIMDLRLIGLWPAISVQQLAAFSRVAGVGLAINVITGGLFVIGDPVRYLINPAFQVKLVMLAIALANIAYFFVRIERRLTSPVPALALRAEMAMVGGLSLVTWFTIIVLGRLLPFYE